MATPEKALAKMREICLALPDTREGRHFGETGFYVGGRIFATCGEKKGVYRIVFGLDPETAAMLVASDPRFTPYDRNARGVVIEAKDVKSWSEIKGFLLESYHLRKPAPKKRFAKAAPVKRAKR